MSRTANRIIKNTGFLYAKMGITVFISLYTTRLILNALGASDFGIFNLVGGAIGMLGFLNASMAGATQRYMSFYYGAGDVDMCKQIFDISIILHFVISVCVLIMLIIAGFFFFNGILNIPDERIEAAVVVYGCFVVSTAITVMSVPFDAAINAHENMGYYAVIGILESILKLTIAYIVVYCLYDKLIVYGVLMACVPLVSMSVLCMFCYRHYEECSIISKKIWNKSLALEIGKYAGWNFLSTASTMINNYGISIVVNAFYGVALNTAIGIAKQIDGQMMVFSQNMIKAVSPVITKCAGAKSEKKMIEYTYSSCKFSFFIFSFFCIPFILETPFVLRMWLKTVPNWAILFCQLQLITTLLSQLGATLNTALVAKGRICNYSIFTSVIYMSSILFSFLFLMFGLPPWSIFISIMSLNVFFYKLMVLIILKKRGDVVIIDYLVKVIFPCVLISILSIVISSIPLFVMQDGLIRFLTVCGLNSIILIFFLVIFGLNSLEKSILFQTINKYRNRF